MPVADYLERLCQAFGVAGFEEEAANVALAELQPFCPDARITPSKSVTGSICCQKPDAKRVLVEAHIDEIGMMVTAVDDEGFLRVTNVGGMDVRSLIACEVTVRGMEKLDGIICSIPPHLMKAGESEEVPKIEELLVDVGLCAQRARELVVAGSPIVLKGPMTRLLSGRLSSKALDNRCGVAAILRALELLSSKKLPFDLHVHFSSQEETGFMGAKMGGAEILPDLAVVLDVTHAHTPDVEKYKTGELGGGAMIGISPMLDRGLSEKMQRICKEEKILYQLEVMSGSTGTNAHALQVIHEGIPTALLSIPLRYMHTGVETVEQEDIEGTARALSAFLSGLSQEDFLC